MCIWNSFHNCQITPTLHTPNANRPDRKFCSPAINVNGQYNRSNLLLEVAGEWIQVDFGRPRRLTGVITQGRGAGTAFGEWVTSFRIAFSYDGTRFHNIKNARGADQARRSHCSAILNFVYINSVYCLHVNSLSRLAIPQAQLTRKKVFEKEELNRPNPTVLRVGRWPVFHRPDRYFTTNLA